jgi:hypothetical protein
VGDSDSAYVAGYTHIILMSPPANKSADAASYLEQASARCCSAPLAEL